MLALILALNIAAASPEVTVSFESERVGDSAYKHTVTVRNGSRSPLGTVVLTPDKPMAFGVFSKPAAADRGWKGLIREEPEGEGINVTFRPAKKPFHTYPIPVGGTHKFFFLTDAIDSLPMRISYAITDTSGDWHKGAVVASPGYLHSP